MELWREHVCTLNEWIKSFAIPATSGANCPAHTATFVSSLWSGSGSWTLTSAQTTYFQCGSRTGRCRRPVTGAVLWSCICTRSAGEAALPPPSPPWAPRRRLAGTTRLWGKLGRRREPRQPAAAMWTPPCFRITADVALRPRAWRRTPVGPTGRFPIGRFPPLRLLLLSSAASSSTLFLLGEEGGCPPHDSRCPVNKWGIQT